MLCVFCVLCGVSVFEEKEEEGDYRSRRERRRETRRRRAQDAEAKRHEIQKEEEEEEHIPLQEGGEEDVDLETFMKEVEEWKEQQKKKLLKGASTSSNLYSEPQTIERSTMDEKTAEERNKVFIVVESHPLVWKNDEGTPLIPRYSVFHCGEEVLVLKV